MKRSSQSRSAESRKADMRPRSKPAFESLRYIPPSEIPKGMSYRWVSVATLGQPDAMNWSNKTIAGWKPVPRDRHSDRFPHIPVAGMDSDATIINIGNLILCERPTVDVLAERRQQQQDTLEQMQAIEFALPDGSPTFNESSEAQFERVVSERRDSAFQDD